MSKDFATCLADKLSVPLLLDDLCLGHLGLFVRLLDVASNLATMDNILA